MIWPIIVICVGSLLIIFACFTYCCMKYKILKPRENNEGINSFPALSSTYDGVSLTEIDRMPSSAPSSSFTYRTVILNDSTKGYPSAPPLPHDNSIQNERVPVYQLTAIGYNSSSEPISVNAYAIPADHIIPNQQIISYSTTSVENL
jgi:hypothetical protein